MPRAFASWAFLPVTGMPPPPRAYPIIIMAAQIVGIAAVFLEPSFSGGAATRFSAIRLGAEAMVVAETGIDDEALATMGASARTISVTVWFHHRSPSEKAGFVIGPKSFIRNENKSPCE